VTSALGLMAARHDRRTLCLTIDPARRLAESLGIKSRQQEMDEDMVEVPVRENLWAMMVDATSAVDLVSRRHLAPGVVADFESNRIFRYLRNTLAGFHEFACMDVLLDLVERGMYDSIILDTPPSQHARDFLEAPQRIEKTVTSPVLNLFMDAGGKGLPGRGLVGLGTGMTMRVIGRLIGQGLVEEVAEFLMLGGDMLRGFHTRSIAMQQFLATGDLGFVVVTSPETVPECIRLHSMLQEMDFSQELFVANRVLLYSDTPCEGLEVRPLRPRLRESQPQIRGPFPPLGATLEAKVDENFANVQLLSQAQLDTLVQLMRKVGTDHAFYAVPQMAEDVFDLPALERLLESMVHLDVSSDG
jgi:anion-transporting  ArsA/GET3 family ATPase